MKQTTPRWMPTRWQVFWICWLVFFGVIGLGSGASALARWFMSLEIWLRIIVGFGGVLVIIAVVDYIAWRINYRRPYGSKKA